MAVKNQEQEMVKDQEVAVKKNQQEDQEQETVNEELLGSRRTPLHLPFVFPLSVPLVFPLSVSLVFHHSLLILGASTAPYLIPLYCQRDSWKDGFESIQYLVSSPP